MIFWMTLQGCCGIILLKKALCTSIQQPSELLTVHALLAAIYHERKQKTENTENTENTETTELKTE